ncbi:GntR family transcriptional regulator [Jeotgalibacillus haloalkalitolerans]|uniref:GntR family transcriptional regulator n=1 Tax=Jeotgalibacillus haloalkalitolerans TaxID=3104292 RepID=A0ABU5KJF7_9BACL|nr:GntR family transcriptional regulator [Jeotgalibacillus sp. HH7-29]MDZ5711395.1 GntR family transcriptional regulator [Jeotgalibacillus sp. HH7-29]
MARPPNMLDATSGEALYLQVKDILISRIEQKIWNAGDLIPTEQELMKEFDVSRTTIRQAISILVQENLLEKKQGRGTIVRPSLIVGSLKKLKGFAEEVMDRGMQPRSKLIRAQKTNALFEEKSILGVPEDGYIYLVERVRFADDIPLAVERSCWPPHIGEILMNEDLDNAHFYEILERNGIFLNRAKDKISAINATVHEADLLGIRPGEALLEMSRLSFGLNEKPLELTKTKYRSDQYHYTIDLHR